MRDVLSLVVDLLQGRCFPFQRVHLIINYILSLIIISHSYSHPFYFTLIPVHLIHNLNICQHCGLINECS